MRSWVESANAPEGHFPLQNLPYGVFSRWGELPRCGVAIGDYVLDLAALAEDGALFSEEASFAFHQPGLNDFMGLGAAEWAAARDRLMELLAEDGRSELKDDASLRDLCLIPLSQATLHLPFQVAEFTDFYSGRQHAFNVGSMFRGADKALPPNWLHLPIAYNGRASTVVVSGTPVRRPLGQIKAPDAERPHLGASQRLDFELELGAVVGMPSEMGRPVSIEEAAEMIFGYVLLNDWSARDIQSWEYQPLGPFQAKAFATSISPWIVAKAALAPFRVAAPERELELLPYLRQTAPMHHDIALQVLLRPDGAERATVIAETNARHLYYSAAQQLAHHALCGCRMNTGDLLGSGTISGPGRREYGSLLELSWNGTEPLSLDTGGTRTFLADGDTLTLTGWAQGRGYRIGFGECAGTILPATTL
jgi:fumarylacetoacetase